MADKTKDKSIKIKVILKKTHDAGEKGMRHEVRG